MHEILDKKKLAERSWRINNFKTLYLLGKLGITQALALVITGPSASECPSGEG